MSEDQTTTCNPFLNHLVVRCLIKHVNPTDKKQLRVVCKSWNDVVTNIFLAKQCVLVLDEQSKIEEYMKTRQVSTLPMTKFEHADITINSCLSWNEVNGGMIVHRFWQYHQEFLRCLKLEVTTLYAKTKIGKLILHNLHNLQELKLTITQFWGNSDPLLTTKEELLEDQISPNRSLTKFSYVDLTSLQNLGETEANQNEFQFPINFKHFSQRYPNLKVLSFIGLANKSMDDFVTCLQQLCKIGVKLHLEELVILVETMCPSVPNNDHIDSLTEISSHHFQILEKLHLELSYQLEPNSLQRFLQTISKSLKVLKLRRFPLPNLTPLHFSSALKFSSLTFLEASDELFESLNFLKSFPVLTTLHIILRDYRQLTPTQILQNTTLDDLHPNMCLNNLFIEQPLDSLECVTRICQLFPNLTHLKARMDNDMLQELCRIGLQSLEQLYIISWDGLTDQGFTGIPDNLLQNVGRQDYCLDYCLEGFRTGPYIGRLKSLKKLIIEMWPDSSNHVSDASMCFGFLDLTNLSIFNGIRTMITPRAAKRFPISTKWYLED